MKIRVREPTSRRTVNDYEMWKADLKRYVVGWVNHYKLADMVSLPQVCSGVNRGGAVYQTGTQAGWLDQQPASYPILRRIRTEP